MAGHAHHPARQLNSSWLRGARCTIRVCVELRSWRTPSVLGSSSQVNADTVEVVSAAIRHS